MNPTIPNTVAPTITPTGGWSAQNQALQNAYGPNGSFTTASLPPAQVQQGLQQAATAQTNLQGAYPTWERGVTGNLQNQAGVPQLQSGVSNLASLFPLYLADQQASNNQGSAGQTLQTGQNVGNPGFNQYANPNAFQPFDPTTLAQYTAANPQTLINNVVPAGTFGSGFSGFNTPSAITSAGAQVPQSASNLISNLANAVGWENMNIVSPAAATASESYQGQMQALNTLLGVLSNQQQFGEQQYLQNQITPLQQAQLDQGKYAPYSYIDSSTGSTKTILIDTKTGKIVTPTNAQGVPLGGKAPTTTAAAALLKVKPILDKNKNTIGYTLPNGQNIYKPTKPTSLGPLNFGGDVTGGESLGPINIGGTQAGNPNLNVATAYDNLKNAGFNDSQIMQYFTQQGWTT